MTNMEDYIDRVRELNPDITIREAALKDGQDFVTLFNSYYKRKTTLAYFEWQFFTSPFPSKLFTAYEGIKLVGYFGVKIYSLSNGVKTGFVIDVLTDEPHRKKGLSYLLEWEAVNFCREFGVVVLSALPNAHGNAALKALKWKSIAKIDTLFLDNTLVKDHLVIGSPFQIPFSQLIVFSKGGTFRHWRFDLNPQYKYETISLGGNKWAIIKLFTDPNTDEVYGDIVDFKVDQDFNEANILFKDIQTKMMKMGINTITTWALPHTYRYFFFEAMGFKSLKQERYFCVKILNPEFSSLTDILQWDLVQADAEIF